MNTEGVLVERRLVPRLYISLYFTYQFQLSGSEETYEGRAILKDISVRGLYFFSETAPKLKSGDVATFVFNFPQSEFDPFLVNQIKGTAVVKRIEPPTEESSRYGIVVEFLEGPVFREAENNQSYS